MKRRIRWRKWKDPFNGPANNTAMPDDEEEPGNSRTNVGSIIVTPMGIIPINEYALPSKIFKFWTGYTNFKITRAVKDVIEETDGVETLDIYSPYRFRLGVAKLFHSYAVKKSITDRLCKEDTKPEIKGRTPVELAKEHLKSKYKYWAIFVLPNGKLETIGNENKSVVEDDIEKHKHIVGTNIISSWDNNEKKTCNK